ncbi:hypothetical protein GCK32_022628 [Trichostrongylus colubriformis]|uniref:Uncharacterized protein n=1 Tax=Trichostrongylus colubriformis TaxID=6319 RepID=A0AAN8FVW5_TRICO
MEESQTLNISAAKFFYRAEIQFSQVGTWT